MDFGELRQMFTDWASRIVRFTQIASASSDGTASVAGRAYAGGPAAPNLKARLLFPFGIRSVPPSGVDAAVIHAAGASARGMIVGCDSKEYGPSDLSDGETAVYSQANPKALVADQHGNTEVTSATVDGVPGDVIVNGGSKPVVLDGDSVDCGHLVFVPNAGTLAASLSYVGPGVPLPDPLAVGAVVLALSGMVSGSAPHFKA